MCKYLLEACIESLEQATEAQNNGAHRLELCDNLAKDGLTPDFLKFISIKISISIPIKVMIRPTHRDFQYTSEEILEIYSSISEFKKLGAEAIVFGAIKENRLDFKLIKEICAFASPMEVTIHKAIDSSDYISSDIELLKSIPNIVSILSSGQKPKAIGAIDKLKEIQLWCGDKLNLIIAGKVTKTNVNQIAKLTGAKEFHGRNIV